MDFIDTFLEYTKDVPSAQLYKLWAAIAALAAAGERRVAVKLSGGLVFSNLFVMLVGGPASGKSQAIKAVRRLWYDSKKLKLAPHSTTKAGLLDRFVVSEQVMQMGERLFKYSSLNIAAPEFGTLVPAHDLEFLSALNYLFDCEPEYAEERRDKSKNLVIHHPSLHMLVGTQPAYLASLLPEEAWGLGFMSRMVMVYSGDTVMTDIFEFEENTGSQWDELVEKVRRVIGLQGNMKFTEEYQEEFRGWRMGGEQPVPEHSKLQYYCARRFLMIVKLSMVSSLSRGEDMLIQAEDFHRAKAWLMGAENVMPDVFRDMVQRSDQQIIQDLHFFLWRLWIKEGKKPIHEARLFNFLKSKTVSERIPRVIDVAVRSRVLTLVPVGNMNYYVPKPASEHGME